MSHLLSPDEFLQQLQLAKEDGFLLERKINLQQKIIQHQAAGKDSMIIFTDRMCPDTDLLEYAQSLGCTVTEHELEYFSGRFKIEWGHLVTSSVTEDTSPC